MRIRQVRIKGFRGIEDSNLLLDGYNVLIGRNGAGKSTFLKALEFFYTPSFGIESDDFFFKETTTAIEVAITFDSLSPNALKEFEPYINKKDSLLTVTKKATWNELSALETYHGSKFQRPDFIEIRKSAGREKIQKYNELIQTGKYKGLASVRSQADVDLQLEKWEKENEDKCQLMIDDGKFFGFKNVGTGKLDKYTDLVFIPAVRDARDDAYETGKSSLKKLLDVTLRRAMDTTGLVANFKEEIASQYKTLLKNDAFCLDKIEANLNKALGRYAPRAGLTLAWQEIPDPRISEPSAVAKLIEDGVESDIIFKGHGLQRSYIMSILHFLAEIQMGIIALEENTELRSLPSLVLAIEEPELYQHPSQARFLAKTLTNMTQAYGDKSPLQVICTSHSPYFVDVQTFDQIRVVRKSPTKTDVTNQPKENIRLKTVTSFTTLNAVAEKLTFAHQPHIPFTGEGQRARLITLLNPYINEAFFSDLVIIVEGEEDRAILLGALPFHSEARFLEEKGMSIIPVNGKTNIDKVKAILDLLCIPNYVIFDKDDASKNSAGNEKTNIALQRLLGLSAPIGNPGQIVTEDYSIFDPDFRTAIRQENGESLWDDYRNKIAVELGYDQPSRADKNPIAIKLLFEKLLADGKNLPEIIKKCLDYIVVKAKCACIY